MRRCAAVTPGWIESICYPRCMYINDMWDGVGYLNYCLRKTSWGCLIIRRGFTNRSNQRWIFLEVETLSEYQVRHNGTCNNNDVEIDLRWKWGKEELPRVNQYTCLGVELWKDSE